MMKKDITFIYEDNIEKSTFELIANEAEKRGYKTKLTKNPFARCEIGVYCNHVNFPQYSKFSVIMLHDIIQGYNRWPDLWYKEPWNKYDIGILPSKQWVDNWKKCSKWFYTRPRKGIFEIGWPKADVISKLQFDETKEYIYKKYKLDKEKRTVLYAPAWENDGKQDEFVKAMLGLDVNILIKQYEWDVKEYPQIASNAKKMYELHKNISDVCILPTSTDIFAAISVSDILVSDESSTMCEAAMMGVPAVSVSDWLIPDTVPSRYPECNYDFVTMTTKNRLHICIQDILRNYNKYQKQTSDFGDQNFSNIGKTSKMIVDLLDDFVEENKIRYPALQANMEEKLSIDRKIRFDLNNVKREIGWNYCQRSKFGRDLWKMLQKMNRLRVKKRHN